MRAFSEGLLLGSYRFSLASGREAGGEPGAQSGGEPGEVGLLVAAEGTALAAVDEARTVAEAVALARDLANTPSLAKTPAWLAGEAVRVAAASGLSARIWEPAELAAEGFGGVLAVGSGSARPPRLIELGYQPAAWTEHVVLVGKGITFDSGGLSLKPNEGMQWMKTDMAGGAAVIAAMSALAKLGARVRVTGLVAAAENMPSGSAMRPGDVITHYGGRTTEVLNTDAEGRLVLADALAYADAVLQPDAMVDLATLTGAARVALGGVMGALYATDDGLAQALLAAGARSGEPLWRMPLVDDYDDALESPVADLANVPHAPNHARRFHRRRPVPARVHRQAPVGAPRHRGSGPVSRRRRRPAEGGHRVRHPVAAALAHRAGPVVTPPSPRPVARHPPASGAGPAARPRAPGRTLP